MLHSLVLELHPDIAEAAVDRFLVDEDNTARQDATVAEVLSIIERDFAWAIGGRTGEGSDIARRPFTSGTAPAPRRVTCGAACAGALPILNSKPTWTSPCR